MPNTPVQAAAGGVPIIRLQDLFAEARDHANLVSMAMDSIGQDRELSAIGAGLYSLQRKMEEIEVALQQVRLAPAGAALHSSGTAEYHARELARAMGAWPDMIRFQITITPHDAEQPLFWLSMPREDMELEQLGDILEVHQEAFKSAEILPADAGDAATEAAYEAEGSAFDDVLKFQCRTTGGKSRKVDYILAHIRHRNRFDTELEAERLEILLNSLI